MQARKYIQKIRMMALEALSQKGKILTLLLKMKKSVVMNLVT